jgi:hypothetical protein
MRLVIQRAPERPECDRANSAAAPPRRARAEPVIAR